MDKQQKDFLGHWVPNSTTDLRLAFTHEVMGLNTRVFVKKGDVAGHFVIYTRSIGDVPSFRVIDSAFAPIRVHAERFMPIRWVLDPDPAPLFKKAETQEWADEVRNALRWALNLPYRPTRLPDGLGEEGVMQPPAPTVPAVAKPAAPTPQRTHRPNGKKARKAAAALEVMAAGDAVH